jgi:hypothetical protein
MSLAIRACSISLIVAFAGQFAWARGHGSGSHSSAGCTVPVTGYYRKDGTYVHAYDRAAPGTASHSGTGVSPYAASGWTATTSVPAVPAVPPVPDSATVRVQGYYRQDGTYVHEYVRSAPGTADAVVGVATSRKPVNTAASALATTGASTTASAVGSTTETAHSYSSASGVQRDSHGRIKRSESAKRDFMRMTGYLHGRPGYVVDHVVPLKRGGCDCPSNMQWQTIQEAKAKDKWE